jgi:hypothetical protein
MSMSTAGYHHVRSVVRRSHKGFVGLFHSLKSNGPIEFESLLERDFLYLMEVDPLVTAVRDQPVEIKWMCDGKIHPHVPDFELGCRTGPEMIEVKPAKKASEPAIVERTRVITALLARQGILYRVLTEEFIRREPTLSRAKTLLHGLGHEPSVEEANAVVRLLSAPTEGLTTIEICARLAAPPSFTNTIYAMVMSGQLVFADTAAPIIPTSRVRLNLRHGEGAQ